MAGRPEGGIGTVLAYHDSTKHSPVSIRSRAHFLDWDNKPHPLKVHTGLERVPLPDNVPSLAVPALEAIGVTSVDASAPGPDLAALARLLVVGAGVHHTVTFPGGDLIHFRNYASAGALYPVEVYVACADLPGLPAGVFHFDPALRALTRLREGDHRDHLVRAAASEASIARAPVVLVLTGIPWRTGWKYTERGYRHLFWDAGMILANVLALAASAKLPAQVVLGFVDSDLAPLLGLEERHELPLCLVSVGLRDREVAAASGEPGERTFRRRSTFSGSDHGRTVERDHAVSSGDERGLGPRRAQLPSSRRFEGSRRTARLHFPVAARMMGAGFPAFTPCHVGVKKL